jgi:hypothetical protein
VDGLNSRANWRTNGTDHDSGLWKPFQPGDGIRLISAISILSGCLKLHGFVTRLKLQILLTQPMSPLPPKSAGLWDP